MKRSLALLSAAMALAGCQPSGQSTDPFLRTTVPPPGTAADAYPGGAPPPQVFQGAPAGTPAPAMTPAPLTPPPNNRFGPPGGSFNYQQSSIDRTKAVQPTGSEYRIGQASLARRSRGVSSGLPAVTAPEAAVAAAPEGRIATPAAFAETSSAAPTLPTRAASTPVAVSSRSAQDSDLRFAGAPSTSTPTTLSASPLVAQAGRAVQAGYAESSLRILPGSSTVASSPPASLETGSATSPSFAAGSPERMRLTVSGDAPEITDLSSKGSAGVQLATYTPTAQWSTEQPAVSRAAFTEPVSLATSTAQTTGGGRYSYSPDYTSLRGKLEYLQSSQQWKLRYIPIDGRTDRYGGSVVLSGAGLDRFKPGDYVAAEGRVTGKSGDGRSFSPQYELARIEPAK